MKRDSDVGLLERLIHDEWLPAWRAAHEGLGGAFRLTTEIDSDVARSVIRGLKRKVVASHGDGSFGLRGGTHTAGTFWHGPRDVSPRPVLFAYEGLLTVAAASELADKGWRSYQMDFEVLADAFDLGVFDPRSNRMLIVMESKTKPSEVDQLVSQIERCGRRGLHEKASCPGSKLGHSKYAGLVAGRPELMWIVAPGVRRLFSPVYLGEGHVTLVETSNEGVLRKPHRLEQLDA